jgi:hypothetical protein
MPQKREPESWVNPPVRAKCPQITSQIHFMYSFALLRATDLRFFPSLYPTHLVLKRTCFSASPILYSHSPASVANLVIQIDRFVGGVRQ